MAHRLGRYRFRVEFLAPAVSATGRPFVMVVRDVRCSSLDDVARVAAADPRDCNVLDVVTRPDRAELVVSRLRGEWKDRAGRPVHTLGSTRVAR